MACGQAVSIGSTFQTWESVTGTFMPLRDLCQAGVSSFGWVNRIAADTLRNLAFRAIIILGEIGYHG